MRTCRGYGTIIPNPCVECAGDGRVRSRRTVTVKIPGGVDSGTRVQLSGQGEVGPGGGPAGDLYVEIEVEPHDIFTRHGDDLHCTSRADDGCRARHHDHLPMLEADLDSDDPELETSAELDVRPGTQSGTEQVLRGHGIPSLRGQQRGNLVATIVVETPTRVDERQRDLLRELAKVAWRRRRPKAGCSRRRSPSSGGSRTPSSDAADLRARRRGIPVGRCERRAGR